MSLFIDSVLNNYRNNPQIINALKGIQLLNLNEFNEWYAPKSRYSPRIEEQAYKKGRGEELNIIRQSSIIEKETISKEVLLDLAEVVCIDPKTNTPAIGKDYGRNAIENLSYNEFDILVAIDPYRKIEAGKTATVSNNKLKSVVGFIIAEYGECARKPNVWSVNLICTKTIDNGKTIKGILLLGAFLYCIKNSGYQQEGILELAGGYENISGFISYTKIGFNKDLSLFGVDLNGTACFSDFNNLPMSANTRILNSNTIINRASETERRQVTNQEDDSGIYNAGRINDTKLQEDLIVANNLLYKLEMNFNIVTTNPRDLPYKEQELLLELDTQFNNNDYKIINELKNRRRNILFQINPNLSTENNVNYIQQCINGICKYVGLKAGKLKTRRKVNLKKKQNKKITKHKNRDHKKKRSTYKSKRIYKK